MTASIAAKPRFSCRLRNRRRGATLLQVLGITGVCAALSAVIYPQFATPEKQAEASVLEQAAVMGTNQVMQTYRMRAFQLIHGPAGFHRHGDAASEKLRMASFEAPVASTPAAQGVVKN